MTDSNELTMKQIFDKKEIIGKKVSDVIIPEGSYQDLWVKFDDNSFVVFTIDDITEGFGYAKQKLSISDDIKNNEDRELLELKLITKEEFEYARNERERISSEYHEEQQLKYKKMIEDSEKDQYNKLKEKYGN